MLNLSTENRAAISSDVPWPVDFLEVVVTSGDSNTVRLTNHFHDIIVTGGDNPGTYLATSHFLNFSDIADNLEVKDNTLDVSLSGVGADITALILSNPIEGSIVTVSRGFYLQDTGVLADGIYQRWSGSVNNYSITDDYNFTNEDKIIISLSCKSLLTTLIARVSGRYTSPQGFKVGNSDDASMEFVPSLPTFNPNFGADE